MREEFIKDQRNMTGGRLFKHRKLMLDAKVWDVQEFKVTNQLKEVAKKRQNRINEYNDKKKKCAAVLTLNVAMMELNVGQLKAVCAFKKRKHDKALPTTKDKLRERYNETIGRADLPCHQWIQEQGYKVVVKEALTSLSLLEEEGDYIEEEETNENKMALL